jgi:hypothetical protein
MGMGIAFAEPILRTPVGALLAMNESAPGIC